MAARRKSSTSATAADLGFEAKLWLAPYKVRIYGPSCGFGGMFGDISKAIPSQVVASA
jgi:hypothetical protein